MILNVSKVRQTAVGNFDLKRVLLQDGVGFDSRALVTAMNSELKASTNYSQEGKNRNKALGSFCRKT